MVVNAVALPGDGGGSSLLAEMKIAALDDGTLHLGRPDGPLLTQLQLPYDVAPLAD
jgi:tRNA-modifying protein YgfZ